MSKLLIILGIAIAVVGVVLVYAPGLLGWFGKLPGDLRWQTERGSAYFPITSMIINSTPRNDDRTLGHSPFAGALACFPPGPKRISRYI